MSTKEHRYSTFAAEPIYSGDFGNAIVDRMAINCGLSIKHKEIGVWPNGQLIFFRVL